MKNIGRNNSSSSTSPPNKGDSKFVEFLEILFPEAMCKDNKNTSGGSKTLSVPKNLKDFKFKNGSRYIGEAKEDKTLEGKGVMFYPEGSIYYGEYKDGSASGEGVFINPQMGNYKGRFANNKAEGYGLFTFKSGSIYKGQWKHDQYSGSGQFVLADGTRIIQTVHNKEEDKV